jgi:8-oxo-dGTP pyrophosphatase MutT (NUDIX family)
MKITTLCFLMKENEVLLAMKKRGFGVGKWNGIGGKVKGGESIEQSIMREAHEEIGVVINEKDLETMGSLIYRFKDNPDWDNHMHVFAVRSWAGEPAESEEMRPQWFTKDQLPFDAMWVDDQHWLPIVLRGEMVNAEFLFNKTGDVIFQAKVNSAHLDRPAA